MLDARRGTILRHLTAACYGTFGVGVSQRTGHVFVKCNDGGVDMLDGRSGRVLRHLTTPLGDLGGPFADEPTNRVFVSDASTVPFVVLDARTGVLLHTVTNGSNLGNGIVDPQTGHVYMTLGGTGGPPTRPVTQVGMLDGRTGALLRRFTVPLNPSVLAFDARGHRLLVASVGPLGANNEPRGNGVLIPTSSRGAV